MPRYLKICTVEKASERLELRSVQLLCYWSIDPNRSGATRRQKWQKLQNLGKKLANAETYHLWVKCIVRLTMGAEAGDNSFISDHVVTKPKVREWKYT